MPRLQLPDELHTDGAPQVHGTPGAAAQRLRVLIVDDDPRVRTALRETIALEPDLLVIGEAGDAVTALNEVLDCDPAVVLMDVLLPDDVAGLELLTTLNRRPGCAVVAMSIRGSLRRKALAAGAVAFVDKGDDIDAMLHSIRAAANRLG